MDRPYFAAIGTACFDEYFTADSWVNEGDKLIVKPMKKQPGGMVANAASVLSGYGPTVYYLDEMNGSAESTALKKSLNGFGLDTRYVQLNENLPDARCLIVLTPKERSILVVDSGKSVRKLSDEAEHMLEGAACTYSTMTELRLIHDHERLIERWHKAGAKLAVDIEPATFETADDPLFSLADILLFNKAGFEKACAGRTPEETKRLLLEKGASVVSVTLGGEGCSLASKDTAFVLPGIDVDAVDTTGAGDTFNASLVYRLFSGDDLRSAAAFANAAAARSVTVPGPKGGVTDERTVRAFLTEKVGKQAAGPSKKR